MGLSSILSDNRCDEQDARALLDFLTVKNTFIHLDRALIESASELAVPRRHRRCVSEPSMKAPNPSPKGFSATPAPMIPLEASRESSKGDVSKTPKCLRFDLTPSFFGGDVPDDESHDDIEKSAIHKAPTPNSVHPYLSGSLSYAKPIKKTTTNVVHPYFSDSVSYTLSIKNTFVHIDHSPSEDEDSDLELPQKSSSVPSMPTLSSASTPAMECLESLPRASPMSFWEHAPSFGLESDSTPTLSLPLEVPSKLPGTPGTLSQFSQSRTYSTRSSDSSWSFEDTASFIHADADADGEDASQTIAPAARGRLSVGAALHASGECKPCAWFWKPESCQWGAECKHCHLCPVGELRRKKKEKRALAKAETKELKRAALAADESKTGEVSCLK